MTTRHKTKPVAPPEVLAGVTHSSSRYYEAYVRTTHVREAVTDHDLVVINVDVSTAVTTAIGALPAILALRPLVEEHLPHHDTSSFDMLEDFVLATGYAHALYLSSDAGSEEIATLGSEGTDVRALLIGDAENLARHRLVDGQRIAELGGTAGYKQLAFDLLSLATLYRNAWAVIAGKTPITPSMLDRAEAIADALLTAVAARETPPTTATDATRDRQRAFTLFVNAYDSVRRAVTYLRWNEDDADRIAPSLYAGRGGGRRKKSEPPATATLPSDAAGSSATVVTPSPAAPPYAPSPPQLPAE